MHLQACRGQVGARWEVEFSFSVWAVRDELVRGCRQRLETACSCGHAGGRGRSGRSFEEWALRAGLARC